ncbi:MAG TPA: hypothetical protein VK051_02535 [Paenalcaligenes sp.]|nr:hypothetical protein [Paenalcaligenes sp.]
MSVCPHCGSKDIAEIMYGYPDFTSEKLKKDLDEGKIALGGCVVLGDVEQPTKKCNQCGEDFGFELGPV